MICAVYTNDDDLIIVKNNMKCKTSHVAGNLEDITLLTVLLEHDKFREEHFQQCLVSFGDSSQTCHDDVMIFN